jgi:hypothetical protein
MVIDPESAPHLADRPGQSFRDDSGGFAVCCPSGTDSPSGNSHWHRPKAHPAPFTPFPGAVRVPSRCPLHDATAGAKFTSALTTCGDASSPDALITCRVMKRRTTTPPPAGLQPPPERNTP